MATLVVAGSMAVVTGSAASAEPGGIVISELNYHDRSDLDTGDFLELANTSASPIDVSGWVLTAGVTGTLPAGSIVPPGGFYVVAKDVTQFTATYGFAPDATYGGNLSNGGETVTISDASLAVVDSVTYADATPWPGAPDGNGPSLELRDLNSDNSLPESWGASLVDGGTPKAVNSLSGSTATAVEDVTATPQRPAPGQSVVVSAKLPAGATATLTYKVMFGADVTVPFLDDAASPGGAGDRVHAATIPGQAAGQLIRYRIDGSAGGTDFAMPTVDDTIRYLGVVVTNPAAASNLPTIEWFMDDAVYNDILANHRLDDYQGDAVVAYDGTVYDGVKMNIRGQSSRLMDKVNWEFNMAPGHEFVAPFLAYPVDEWALQRDPDPLADLGWDTIGKAGARRLAITAVRSQRNGQFWSVGRFMEKLDGTWRDVQGVKDWAIYKGDGGGLAKTASPATLQSYEWLDKKTREDEDYSDAWALGQAVDAPASAAQKAWLQENVNVPEVINYMALSSLMRHTDSGWKNWYIARDTEGTGRWELWFWDVNWIWATDAEDHNGTFLTPDVQNHLEMAMLQYPDYRQMFFRRLRTLADQFLAPGDYEAKWDAIVDPYVPDWALDTAKWPETRTSTLARVKFLQGLTDRRSVIAANTGPGKDVPTSQSPNASVVINELQYHPAGSDDSEFIELTNNSSEAVDLSGWTIDAVDLTIQAGTVLLPGAQVVFVSDDVAFRTQFGPTLFVGGQYSGKLSNSGEEVTLRDGDRVVDTVTYGTSDPWPAAADGTGPSLVLGDPGFDNALASSWFASATPGGTPGAPNGVQLPADTTPPTAPTGLSSSGVAATGIGLSWSASTDDRSVASYRVIRNGTVIATVTGLSYTDAAVTGSTTYTYTVRAVDSSGNVGPASDPVAVTTPAGWTPALFGDTFTATDGSPWSSAWVSGIQNGTTTIQGNAGRLAFDNVTGAYSQVQLAGLPARANSETLLSYQWSSTSGGAYFDLYVRGSGGWNNPYRPRTGYGLELSSSSTSVALRRNVNGTTTTLNTSAANSVTTAKQWLRIRAVGSTIQYRIWRDGQAEPTTWNASVTDGQVTAPGTLFMTLIRGGSNSGVKYVAIDDVTVGSGDGSVVIPPAPDTTPPSAPTALAASNVGQTQLTLTWGAATDDTGVTGYRVLRDGIVVGTPTGTSFTDTGLTASTTYSYVVRAVDAAGNVSGDSTTITPTTAGVPVPDTTPPSAPTGLAASNVGQTQVTLAWTASTDDQGVTGYQVVRDGVVVATPTGTGYTDTGLTASTAYSYVVRAADAAGNVSGDSNPVAVTTADVPPPSTTLFADLFGGANGSAWGAGWTTTSTSGSTTQQGGAGRLSVNDTAGASARAQLTGLAARTDSEALLSYQWSATSAVTYFNVYLRGSGGWSNAYRPANGYGLELASNSTTVTVRRVTGGTVSSLASVSGATSLTTAKQWLRFRVVGSTIQFKTWIDGQAEPTTWRSSQTNGQVTAPGQLYLSNVRGGANSGAKYVAIDDLSITTGDSTPPPPDTTAPSAPTGLAASGVGADRLTLTWNAATDDTAVAGYRVVRDGSVVGTPTGTSFTDTGLSPLTTYSYLVRAVDAADNVSGDSNTITPTTADVPPPSSSLFGDLFGLADGSAWGAGWTTSVSGGSATVQGGAGRLAINDATGAYARAQLSGLAPRADSEALLSYQWSGTGPRTYFSVYLRSSGGWSNAYRPTNGYGLELTSDSAYVTLRRVNGGTVTNLASANANTVTTAKQWIRLRVVGSTIQFKTWLDGQAEPAAWTATVSDGSVTAAGQLFLTNVRSSSNSGTKYVAIDDVDVTDGN